jgi:Fe-Mn family superoxide dismutase
MADGPYTLPPLPYEYAALEPHVSGQIMELHHDKHHANYVKGANTALEQLEGARSSSDFGLVTKLEKDLAFNVAGHVMHSLFWQNLSPDGGQPEGELAEQLQRDFGGLEAFKAHFTAAANTIQGSGWALASWEPTAGRIIVQQVYDHQNNHAQGGVPLLTFDAWEHAFYLQYKNVKADFFNAVWNVFDWEDVANKFKAAKETDWTGVA